MRLKLRCRVLFLILAVIFLLRRRLKKGRARRSFAVDYLLSCYKSFAIFRFEYLIVLGCRLYLRLGIFVLYIRFEFDNCLGCDLVVLFVVCCVCISLYNRWWSWCFYPLLYCSAFWGLVYVMVYYCYDSIQFPIVFDLRSRSKSVITYSDYWVIYVLGDI